MKIFLAALPLASSATNCSGKEVPRAALNRRSGCMGQNRYRFAGLRSQT